MTALSEPIERMIGEAPPGLLSNAELNVMEEDEQPTELTESNERSVSDSREERRREEELQQAEARRLAEEERRRAGRTPAGRSPRLPSRSVAERKNSSRPKPKGHPSRSIAERKNSSRPKPDG